MNRRQFLATFGLLLAIPKFQFSQNKKLVFTTGDYIQGRHYPIGDYGFGDVPMRPFGPPEVKISKLSELFPRKLSKKSNEG